MKTKKSILPRLLSMALVVLLALTAAVPVFAATGEDADNTNLKITIHNNTGLPDMTANQFAVYQLFKGTPKQENNPAAGEEGSVWNPNHWNDYILADIEWGTSIPDKDAQKALLDALKALDPTKTDWIDDTVNPFTSVTTAAQLGEVLAAHKENKFMQGFANFLLTGKTGNTSFLTPLKVTGTLNGKEGTEQTLTYDLTETGTGYYIFEDTSSPATAKAVSEYIVAVMGSQDIDLKASVPTVDKTVNGSEGATADIGEPVTFVLKGTLPKNIGDFATYTYIFHDKLSPGLTFVEGSVTVKIGATPLEAGKYVLNKSPEDGCSLEIVISDLKALAKELSIDLTAATEITVEYSAKLNANAVVGAGDSATGLGNPNKVTLEYSNDPHALDKTTETPPDTVRVYTFGLALHKVGNDKDHSTGLEDASFTLQKGEQYAEFETNEKGQKVFKQWVAATTVEDLIAKYDAAKEAWDKAQPAEQTSDVEDSAGANLKKAIADLENYTISSKAGGVMPEVVGLDAGTYTLKEVITPAGYNTMGEFTIKIDAAFEGNNLKSFTYTPSEGAAKTYNPTEGSDVYVSGLIPQNLINVKAPFLPFTGGIGTLIFYVLGIALIAGAVTYLVIAAKKRKKAEENA